MTVNLIQGDALTVARTLPDCSVQTIVTSPPYYGLRDYGIDPLVWGGDPDCDHVWAECIQPAANGITHDGGMTGETLSGNSATRQPKRSDFCVRCGAWRGTLGLEPTPELYIDHTVSIFRELRRVLKDDGTLWVNMGDSYCGVPSESVSQRVHTRISLYTATAQENRKGRADRTRNMYAGGLKPKDLIGAPWLLAFALRADGWYLRRDIIWHKPNPMPESVDDRPTNAHEYLFLLSKSARYYYDAEAIKEPGVGRNMTQEEYEEAKRTTSEAWYQRADNPFGKKKSGAKITGLCTPTGRNRRDVWSIATQPYPEAHFATYPPDLIEPCILAGTSERGECPKCGRAWIRILEPDAERKTQLGKGYHDHSHDLSEGMSQDKAMPQPKGGYITVGWRPQCECGPLVDVPPITFVIPGVILHEPPAPIPQTVLDPFNGSGTTGSVAIQHNRNYVGIELKAEYLELTRKRLGQTPIMLPGILAEI